jgi:NAD(P)-dependent dehydrogenase (short-subunit alcohol dehydrogenase family)
MAVNLKGAFRLSALIGTRIAERGGGVIINMSSVGSIAPSAHKLPDTRAKAGLNTRADGLSRALGPSVRVNTIVAGPFITDIRKA